ncbi:MAG: RecX family transcriptional regulator [Erysipelotrichaceae bacterium]|nr:RecX family transcriptional regulator [Erysipelotrichaceae bacterium]
MKIGMFVDAYIPEINGVVSSVVTLKESLESLGHEVFVVTTKPKSVTDKMLAEEAKDGHILRLNGIELKALYGYVLAAPFYLSKFDLIKNWNLDVMHVHTEFGVGIFARILSKTLHIPLVSTYHTMYEDYTHYVNPMNIRIVEDTTKFGAQKLSKLYSQLCTALIVPTNKTKERLAGYGVTKPMHIIPTGLNLDMYNPARTSEETVKELRGKLGIAEDEFMLVYVGRIAEEKSIDFVLRGYRKMAMPHKVRLVVVGGGPQLDDLRKLARELEIDVVFTDRVLHEEVPAYYHAADAFVSASLSETQGMTFIEAMASGLMVFARPDEVLEGIVVEGKTGFLFTTEEEFAGKVLDFAALPKETRLQYRKQAMDQVLCFDRRVFGEKVMEVYQYAIDVKRKLNEVKSVKMKGDLVELTMVKQEQSYKLSLSLDDYMALGIHKDSVFTDEELEDLRKKEARALAWYMCIRKLASKDHTRKEMQQLLFRQSSLSVTEVNQLLDELCDKGYVNDETYMMTQIEEMCQSGYGNEKIVHLLTQKGIVQERVERVLAELGEDNQLQRGKQWAEKAVKKLRNKSVAMAKTTLTQKLVGQGYPVDVAKSVVARMDFSENEENQNVSLQKDFEKAVRKYGTKHTGKDLRNKVFRYLMGKGYPSDSVYDILNETEWNHEE